MVRRGLIHITEGSPYGTSNTQNLTPPPQYSYAWVANGGASAGGKVGNTVSVLRYVSGSLPDGVYKTITVKDNPYYILFSPGADYAYVFCVYQGNYYIVQVNTTDYEVINTYLLTSSAGAYSPIPAMGPSGDHIYVPMGIGADTYLYDLNTQNGQISILDIPNGGNPIQAIYSQSTNRVIAAFSSSTSYVYVVNPDDLSIDETFTYASTYIAQIGFAGGGNFVVVATENEGEWNAIELSSMTSYPLKGISGFPISYNQFTVSSNGAYIYGLNGIYNSSGFLTELQVQEVSMQSLSVVNTYAIPSSYGTTSTPAGIAYMPQYNIIVVATGANPQGEYYSPWLNASTGEVLNFFALPSPPKAVFVYGNYVFFTMSSDYVWVSYLSSAQSGSGTEILSGILPSYVVVQP